MHPSVSKRSLSKEMFVVTVAVLAAAHLLFRLRFIDVINEYLSVFVAVILLYVPTMVLWLRGRMVDFVERTWRDVARSVAVFAAAAVTIYPIFMLLAHAWQLWIMDYQGFKPAPFPDLWRVVIYQLVIVALPEEFFFRGYVQSGLNVVFPRRRRILGITVGWGFIITALVFAFAHSLITYQWWHFSIFFPGLVFGYLRERTGSITAPILFHASSNILMNWISRCYY